MSRELKAMIRATMILACGASFCFIPWFSLLLFQPVLDARGLHRVQPIECDNLIFGTSRSAQGIAPSELAASCPDLNRTFNFSFNQKDSPWRMTYAEVCVQKAEKSIQSDSPTFICAVDPWAFDRTIGSAENSIFNSVSNVSDKYSFEWIFFGTTPLQVIGGNEKPDLIGAFYGALKQILQRSKSNSNERQGWLPNPHPTEDADFSGKIASYRNKKMKRKEVVLSDETMALKWMIDQLTTKYPSCSIALVRMPICEGFRALEDSLSPNFSEYFQSYSATMKNVEYYDFSDAMDEFSFVDGNHLHAEAARNFSQQLPLEICNQN